MKKLISRILVAAMVLSMLSTCALAAEESLEMPFATANLFDHAPIGKTTAFIAKNYDEEPSEQTVYLFPEETQVVSRGLSYCTPVSDGVVLPASQQLPMTMEPGAIYWVGYFDLLNTGNKISVYAMVGEAEEPKPEEKPAIPATGTAYTLKQTAVLDGKEVAFDTYALKDENGNGTNYMKIRDLAYVLNGSAAQFALGYDAGSISFTSKTPYAPDGTEMTVPFSGDQTYSVTPGTFRVDGKEVKMTTVSILDAAGNGYTYIKVRDLAEALNFYVGWNGKIVIDTGRPYEA